MARGLQNMEKGGPGGKQSGSGPKGQARGAGETVLPGPPYEPPKGAGHPLEQVEDGYVAVDQRNLGHSGYKDTVRERTGATVVVAGAWQDPEGDPGLSPSLTVATARPGVCRAAAPLL